MTEQEAIAYIENYGWSTTRLGLERTRELLAGLGDPQKKLKFIHVAGSNGKGSACAMFDAILRAAGYRTGLYTSPYLEVFNERMRVNGENIPGARLAALTERVMRIAEAMEDHPSQFELVTAVAMQYFYEERCDVVVLEVGMGGALDSTNAIDAPELAVITNIGLEHTEYLGNTLEEIAATKAGIIKPGCSCVCYDGAPEVTEVIRRVCAEKRAPLSRVDFSRLEPLDHGPDGQRFAWDGAAYQLALLGPHQLHNAALVLTGVEALRARGTEIPDAAVRAGLKAVRWPARMELLCRDPLFILDGGHNPQCAGALAESLDLLLPGQKAVFLAGVLADKDYPAIFDRLTPFAREFICVTPDSPRRLTAAELAAYLTSRGAKATACESIAGGVSLALERAGEGVPVVAFGSLYLAGTVRNVFPARYRGWLRQNRVRARDALTQEERAAKSARAVERIAESAVFRNAKTVMLYDHVRGELSLDALPAHPAAAGKRFVYPRCVSETELAAYIPGGWKPGPFGVREPDPERSGPAAPEEIDLVICPCAAFDEGGSRLGMGAGYYDRWLPKCVNAVACAAAFEAQKAAALPAEAWDRPMDLVFTEDDTYYRQK